MPFKKEAERRKERFTKLFPAGVRLTISVPPVAYYFYYAVSEKRVWKL